MVPIELGVRNEFNPPQEINGKRVLSAILGALFIALWFGPGSFDSKHELPAFFGMIMGIPIGWALGGTFGSDELAGHRVILGPHGYLSAMAFMPWKRVSRVDKDSSVPTRRHIVFPNERGPVFHIPEDQVEQVDAYIAERLAEAHQPDSA